MIALAALVAISQPMTSQSWFVRTVDRTDGISVSQTAARRMEAPGKPTVWLVGVSHIGLKAYYSQIQELLDAQEVVLFEGVRPEGKTQAQVPAPGKATAPIYKIVGDAIGLDFQLSDIRYDRPTWVNSDLSLEQLKKMNRTAKGSAKSAQFDTVLKMLDSNSEQAKMLGSFFQSASAGMKEAFKIFLVQKLSKVDTLLGAVADPGLLNLLLKERNRSVESFLERQIQRSTPPKSVAIFYGAAHQRDIETAIQAKYGYREVEQRWFTFAKADRNKLDDSGRQFLSVLEKGLGGL